MPDRAVSTVVSYVLALGILAILVTGLISGFVPFVTDQQQDAAQSTMRVYGNDVAGDLQVADRLARRNGTNRTVELTTRLPERVSGSRYEIEFENATDADGAPAYTYDVWLRPDDFDGNTLVHVRTRTPLAPGSVDAPLDGGDLHIEYDPAAAELVITDA